MREIIKRFLAERRVWVAIPEIAGLLSEAAERFQKDVLANIPIEDIIAGKYTWHHPDTPEPDDGIIYKHPNQTGDVWTLVHGVLQDHKLFLQWRLRTEDMFRERGLYQEVFNDFFRVMEEIRWRVDRVIIDILAALHEEWPHLGALGHKEHATVTRVMAYLGERNDGSGLAGKIHTDKNDVTIHLYDSKPGLLVQAVDGRPDLFDLVETRPGEALAFVSDRFARLSGIPAVRHSAKENGRRTVIVMFVHFTHADGS